MRTFILLGLIIASNACRVTDDEPAAKLAVERARAAREPAEPQIGYPEGPWWSEDTGRLLLAGSHILVSHRETKPTQRLIWANPVDRSRLEAKQRAWKLYLELRSNAERFAEVAARESDEPITRSFGGALGTFYVDSVPHVFLDAFGHVREGEVTRPVETEQGFHVLRRQKPTAPIRLNLAHLVIKYEGVSGWLRNDRVAVNRSREAAQALAERVAREAQQAPDRFADLVREYSDAEDALRDGDMGALSSHDVTDPADAPLIAVAERLPEGAVSEVIALESSGFHIVRRLRPAPRPALAASVITIGYVDSPLSRLRPNATRSRVEAERLAQRIVRRLARHPDQFEALRAEHCDQVMCDAVTSWTQGRHLFALEAAVARLRVGEVGTQPVDSPLGLLILRREDAAAHPPPPEPTPTFAFPGGFAQGWDAESASGS